MEMILNRDGNDSENGYGLWVTLRLKFQIWGWIFFFFLPKVVYSTFVALKEREESNGFTKLTAFHLSK